MTLITPKRFVILHHRVGGAFERTDRDHFDWLFETGPTLTTFATAVVNSMQTEFTIPCDRLPNHRIEYLDFEGPIPDRGELRNRGRVQRVVAGTFFTTRDTHQFFNATLTIEEILFGSTRLGKTIQPRQSSKIEFRLGSEQKWILQHTPIQLED